MNKEKIQRTIREAFLASLPVMAGYIVLGMGFGILLTSKGYSVWWAILMSICVYAGSMQYVGVDLLTGGASVISTALMTFMVNARHLFYGISMIRKYKDMGWRKFYAIFALSDETYSLVVADRELPEGVDYRNFAFLVTLMDQIYWVIGTVLGAVLNHTIEFNSAGVEFSMTALFVVIFVDQWEQKKDHLPALLGLVVSILCLILFGRDNFLIPSMILIMAGLMIVNHMRGGKQ